MSWFNRLGRPWSQLSPAEREAFDTMMQGFYRQNAEASRDMQRRADLPGPKYLRDGPAAPAEPMEG